ncbi:hypothetical protein GCM10009555_031940 [Acrocarpospora macrocephala]|uniref:DUF732 domain-containing protein n=1 Tax=Acrocarpospora macrocephala TaxID=150177 RepID=A0A5M3WT39_9ACTN|nr:hypothetical protein [Acrocarpospora macrocephala]GES12525.1 hypothetical protein Amac_061220 [Acrocarpospora macrocephala]
MTEQSPARRRLSRRTGFGLAMTASAAALVMFAASPALASPLFVGGARGLTAENAIQGAFDDARISAQAEGFYGACTVVGEPQVFETFTDPLFGHLFHAQVAMTCAR